MFHGNRSPPINRQVAAGVVRERRHVKPREVDDLNLAIVDFDFQLLFINLLNQLRRNDHSPPLRHDTLRELPCSGQEDVQPSASPSARRDTV
ncbi:unnamed protein product [Microthlaspi erraticum]|uniref:Uncharacterized protein n=1 Tax=Microthlaspi erraticum TaxID=1685480 RepID=A0A6D2JJY3_9BRAS|nr:unnamed protein product [Microthlaspi erraticum]